MSQKSVLSLVRLQQQQLLTVPVCARCAHEWANWEQPLNWDISALYSSEFRQVYKKPSQTTQNRFVFG